jgi:hypothetical protein
MKTVGDEIRNRPVISSSLDDGGESDLLDVEPGTLTVDAVARDAGRRTLIRLLRGRTRSALAMEHSGQVLRSAVDRAVRKRGRADAGRLDGLAER